MPQDLHGILVAIGTAVLVVFLIYRRVRRNVGRQPVSMKRLWIRVGILTAICLAILFQASVHMNNWLGAGVGALIGVAVAIYALRRTVFETTPEGNFYTPHLLIGLALSGLLIGRIGYRFISNAYLLQNAAANPDSVPQPPGNSFTHAFDNPLTIGLFFITAGYNIFFCYSVIRHFQKKITPAQE